MSLHEFGFKPSMGGQIEPNSWKTGKNSKIPVWVEGIFVILLAILDDSHYQNSQKWPPCLNH